MRQRTTERTARDFKRTEDARRNLREAFVLLGDEPQRTKSDLVTITERTAHTTLLRARKAWK